jgi:4a-hydroxytetrahydrobiopterin dehydratase
MTEWMSLKKFHESEGAEDWRVLGEGACTFFPTGSLAAGARLVNAISELEGLDPHHPDMDVRHDGVTVRLITITDGFYGVTERDLALARRISALAKDLGVPADPSAVQTIQVAIDALVLPEVMSFWRAVLGYEYRGGSPEEDLYDPLGRGGPFWSSRWRSRVPSATGSTSTSGYRTIRLRRA